MTTVETLQRELAAALAERDEARARQAALAEVLQAINASAGDFTAVFDLILARAMALCDAPFGSLLGYDGQCLTMLAEHGSPTAMVEYWSTPQPVGPESATARVLREGKTSQIADLSLTDNYLKLRLPITVASVELGHIRTLVQVPLVGEHDTIGVFILYRQEVRPFTDAQLALVESFAAQATLAMENARRFAEQREALEQQAATAEVLQVINASPGNLGPVFEAILQKTMHLCEAAFGLCSRVEGDVFEFVADHGVPPELVESTRKLQSPPPNSGLGRLIAGESVVQLVDLANTDVYRAGFVGAKALVDIGGAKTAIFVALRKDGLLKGAIVMYRREVRAFSDKQVALLQNFAAQAVIAMENARLLTEQREALEQQTATAEILRVIAQSPTDVSPVLEAVAKATLRFCGAEDVAIDLREGEIWRCVAHAGILKSPVGMTNPIGRKDLPGRTMIERRVTEIPDIAATTDDETAFDREVARQVGFRAALSAPLLGKNEALGALIVHRTTPGAFSQRQIALLESFAAQAVVALENVRLFTELKESLDQQTATAEILRVISESPTDVKPVLKAVASAARRFCGAPDATIILRDGDALVMAEHNGSLGQFRGERIPLDSTSSSGRAVLERRTFHYPDIELLDPVEHRTAIDMSRRTKVRAVLSAPMVRDNEAVGVILLRNPVPGPFSPRQIELAEIFAAQAVIALENTRLFTELKESLDYQTATSELLDVISRSNTDIQPVFETMLASAARLCGVEKGDVAILQGDVYRHVAFVGCDPDELAWLKSRITVPGRGTSTARALLERRTDHVLDQSRDPERIAPKEATRERTTLAVPLLRNGEPVGVISLLRDHVEPFSDRQIALIETFADQAVIAMENARLLSELTKRTDELVQSLEYQTATSEVLEVISRSTTDLQPVLEAMTAAAVRLCGVKTGGLSVRRGDTLQFVALVGQTPEFERWQMSAPIPLERGILIAEAVLDKAPAQVVDVMETEEYKAGAKIERAVVDLGGHRTILHVPLLRDDEAVGVLTVSRSEPLAFTERQISLIETFADQAVIAMENARLLTELTQRTDDLTESLEYQTATSELLEVISRSASDIQPVLETMLASAARLCGAAISGVVIRQGSEFRYSALRGGTPELYEALRARPIKPARDTVAGHVLLSAEVVHVADVHTYPEYSFPEVMKVARTILGVPLMRENETLGAIVLTRDHVEPFTDRQIELVRTFAGQAVIAMENARLLGELRESLDQQTATAEILQVINTSPGDLMPVFRAILEKAHSSCGADMGSLFSWDGTHICAAVTMGYDPEIDGILRTPRLPPSWVTDLVSGKQRFFHRTFDRDRTNEEAAPFGPRFAAGSGIRTNLIIPLRKDEAVLGFISANRREVRPYSDKEISLLENFAAQAVIAMENARLLNEVRQRETELAVTFEHMGDGVAMFDAALKLASWNRHFQELLDIPDSFLTARPGLEDYVRLLVQRGELGHDNPDEEIARYRDRANAAWSAERTRPDGRIIEARNNPVPGGGAVLIYSDITERKKAEAEIAAARDAAEAALERQTATADILKAIASSPTDVQPVLDVLVKAAVRFCGATDAVIHMRDGSDTILAAHEGPLAVGPHNRVPLNRETGFGAAILGATTIHRPDIAALDPVEFAAAHRFSRELGFRAVIVVPMLREGTAIGAISLRRVDPGVYTQQQIELLETFAAQAVIAVENVRLFTELRDSLERLKAAQANLVQSEKMASLGQLTAGIAHEIKNPLNFVNNFATLSVDLLDELKEVAGPALATLDEDKRAEVDETMELLTGNLGKIAEHGKRADGIVKSMLSHSRGGAGDWASADINALVEEALNLAYHGARSQDKEFNVTLERDLEKTGAPIEVVPQDVTRVFLNLFGNGFYAANKRRLGAKQSGFKPTLKVSTRDLGDRVEVKVRDNGIGMPPEVKEKLFQPFFTTKPTGEGTGLGLSISYDIVTQQHGGTIEVESEPDNYTEFTIRLPRARRAAPAARGA